MRAKATKRILAGDTESRVLYGGFLSLLLVGFVQLPTFAQSTEETNNRSTGSSNSFTITVTSTHGIQSSTSRTPDFNVEAYGQMFVGEDSTSQQENKDGTTGYMQSGGGEGLGQTAGVSGMQRINFQPGSCTGTGADETCTGTYYKTKITSKDADAICGQADFCEIPGIGNASASAVGQTTTSITVNSTESSFVNSFIKSFSSD